MNLVSIIILNYGDEEDTESCVKSILSYTSPEEFELIIVNNGKDYKTNWAERFPQNKIKVLFNDINTGFAGANNQAAKAAEGRFLLFLNNDTIFTKPVLPQLIRTFKQNADVLNPIIYYYQTPKIWFAGARFNRFTGLVSHLKNSGGRISELLTGCALFISKETYIKAGGFREDYFCYYEDSDLSMRLSGAGLKLKVTDSTSIQHKVSISSGGELNPVAEYYLTRNNLLFNLRFNPYFFCVVYFILFFNLYRIFKFIFLAFRPDKAQAVMLGSVHFFIGKFKKLNGSKFINKINFRRHNGI